MDIKMAPLSSYCNIPTKSIIPLTIHPLINPLQTPQTPHTIPQIPQTPLLHTIPPTPRPPMTALPPLPIHNSRKDLRLGAQMARSRAKIVHNRDITRCAGVVAGLDGGRGDRGGGRLLHDCLRGDGCFEDGSLDGLWWRVVRGEVGRVEGHAAASSADGIGVRRRSASLRGGGGGAVCEAGLWGSVLRRVCGGIHVHLVRRTGICLPALRWTWRRR